MKVRRRSPNKAKQKEKYFQMRVVWKHPLSMPDTKIEIAPGFQIVAVGIQGHIPCIWFEHDPTAELKTQRFEIYGTGHPIPDNRRWVGTFFEPPFVWHVYYNYSSPDTSENTNNKENWIELKTLLTNEQNNKLSNEENWNELKILLTDEQYSKLNNDLAKMSHQRRRAEADSRDIPMY